MNKEGEKITDINRREKLSKRWTALKSERSSWIPHWQEISRVLMPRNGRFITTDRNKGDKRHHEIYDNTGSRSLKILGAGMMAGASSPARKWFKLETPDQDLNRFKPVKMWLDSVEDLMMAVFARSNTYRFLHQSYEELGGFGTHANIIMPDYHNVIHNHSLTIGEYALATDFKGNVTTLYREFQKTVGETIKEFGKDNVSKTCLRLYEQGELQSPVQIVHAIEPRADRDRRFLDDLNMPYESSYWEHGSDEEKFLRVSGFEQFRCTCPRWATNGGDVYGHSPGMESLGDMRQLQQENLRKGQAIDFQSNPPLQVPLSMMGRETERFPGGINYVDSTGNNAGIRSMFEVNLDINALREDIMDVRQRINASFYADMFLMLANATDTRMTATEVAERHEEKLLMLGPVIERLHNELLEPLINITFKTMADADILPPPPEELEGMDLKVVFVSMLAQAQRSVGVNSMGRFMNEVTAFAANTGNPSVLDKVDSDVWVDELANQLGVDPALVIDTQEANGVREQRAAMQAQQAKMDAAQQQAATAKDLASAPTDEENALTALGR